jgi:hypothetical protein
MISESYGKPPAMAIMTPKRLSMFRYMVCVSNYLKGFSSWFAVSGVIHPYIAW